MENQEEIEVAFEAWYQRVIVRGPATRQINVTQEDIDNALELQATGQYVATIHCPVGLAMSRVFPGVRVTQWFLTINRNTDGRKMLLYYTPQSVKEFIADFDRHNPVKPMAFSISI